MTEYYKKIDKSVFRYGVSIPLKYKDAFLQNVAIPLGTSRKVTLSFNGKAYAAVIIHLNRRQSTPVFQIRWDQNTELINELKKEFIQSYLAIESQNYDAKVKGKYYTTDLLGGNQEVLIFRPLSPTQIELETFIRVATPYDNIFRRLIEENAFGWLSQTKRDYLIVKTTKWFDSTELIDHEDSPYVVYYLVDEIKKQLYIGSAIRLGDRVKVGRKEIPCWNKFKYDIIHPQYHHLLRRIEFHTIGSFAGLLKNNGKVQPLDISEFTLVNINWSKRI